MHWVGTDGEQINCFLPALDYLTIFLPDLEKDFVT